MTSERNLPPGVTDRDVEEAMGAIAQCEICGRDYRPDRDGSNGGLCPRCQCGDEQEDWRRDR